MNLIELIESAKDTRMLMVGETIEDVYHYVNPLGRPVKEMILSTEWQRTETFQGGIAAAACHARDICNVDTWSDCFVRKERWVEMAHTRKLFQVQHPICVIAQPTNSLVDHDVIAYIDYGHAPKKPLVGRFVALNVQTNSSNYGFNLVREEDNADYLVLDELEARLSTANRNGPLQDSLLALARNAPKVVITLGRDGAIGWSEEHGICKAPAMTTRVVDTMGAGDCFFAVTAPLAKSGTLSELLAIGNAAAALKCQIIGHQESVTKEALIGYIQSNYKN